MRFDADGHLIYANPASARGPPDASASPSATRLPAETIARFEAVAPERGFVEFVADSRTYAVWPVPIRDLDFTNLYGMDVTAERAIVKFPDQNPNPVLRIDWDGTLVVRQPGERRSRATGWGSRSGRRCPPDLPRDAPRAGPGGRRGHGRGRGGRPDLRAAAGRRPRVRLHQRLRHRRHRGQGARAAGARRTSACCSTSCPAPIADRLRDGRAAHRRPLRRRDPACSPTSSSSPGCRRRCRPQELVGVLNDVFTVFDDLVDRYGLEKVKTIGDAYMVVGGMSERHRRPPGARRRDGPRPRRRRSAGSRRPRGSASRSGSASTAARSWPA